MSKNICIIALVTVLCCGIMSLRPGYEKYKKAHALIGWINAAIWICIYIHDIF